MLIVGGPSKTLKLLTAMFVIMPTHYIKVELCDTIQIHLRSTTMEWQPLKKSMIHKRRVLAGCYVFKKLLKTTDLLVIG